MYKNDLSETINCTHKLFLDDTSIYASINDDIKNDVQNSIINDWDQIESWSKQWMVKFNALKTESLHVTRRNIDKYPDFTFEQQCITKTNQNKHLGLTLSKDLTWKSHLISICQKVVKRVDMLKALKLKLNSKTLETIYLSFVRPLLEYDDVVWDNAPRHEKFYLDLEKLQRCNAHNMWLQ